MRVVFPAVLVEIGEGKHRLCPGVDRIQPDGAFHQVPELQVLRRRYLRPHLPRTEDQVIGVEVRRSLPQRPLPLDVADADSQRTDDPLGDLVLDREHVFQSFVVCPGP